MSCVFSLSNLLHRREIVWNEKGLRWNLRQHIVFFHLNWKINWHTFVAQEIFINDKLQNKLTFLYLHLLRFYSIFYWSWKCIDNIRGNSFRGQTTFSEVQERNFFAWINSSIDDIINNICKISRDPKLKQLFSLNSSSKVPRSEKEKQKQTFHISLCFARENLPSNCFWHFQSRIFLSRVNIETRALGNFFVKLLSLLNWNENCCA